MIASPWRPAADAVLRGVDVYCTRCESFVNNFTKKFFVHVDCVCSHIECKDPRVHTHTLMTRVCDAACQMAE